MADLRPGGAGSFARYYATTSTHVFLEAEVAPGTWNWYYMDANLAPAPISNLDPALAGQPLRNFRATNDLFFFTVGDSNQFWRTDGTAEGTFALDQRSYGQRVGQRTVLNDQLFFTAGTTSVFSGRLWRADGTPGGTAEFRPDANLDSVQNLSVVGNRMIFRNGGWNSTGLWVSDGTDAGTRRLERPDGSVIDAYPTRVAGNDEVFYFRSSNAI